MVLPKTLSCFLLALSLAKVHGDPVADTINIALNAGVVTTTMLAGLTTTQILDKISQQLGNYIAFQYNYGGIDENDMLTYDDFTETQIDAGYADYDANAVAKMQTGDPSYAIVGNALTAPNPFNPAGLAIIGVVNSVVSGGETYAYSRMYYNAVIVNPIVQKYGLDSVLCTTPGCF